jgi:hypothetical protein
VLRFFRINDPYRLLAVLIILVAIGLPLFIDPAAIMWQELKGLVIGEALNQGNSIFTSIVDDTGPIAAWTEGWLDFLFGRSISARRMLALALIFFQASFFAVLLISNKAHNENTYLPALVFGVLAFFSFDMISLSPELLASTVLLFALNNLFKEIEFKQQRDELVLNAGIYLGVSSLILFSYSVFLIGSLLVLLIFTRITFRKAMLLIFGFALPHILLVSLFFFRNEQSYLFQYFYAPNFTLSTSYSISQFSLFILCAVPMAYLLFSLVMLNREAHFTKYQSQLMQVMLLWLVISFFHVLFTRERTPHSLYVFLPPLTYFISHYLLLIRRKWLAEVTLLFLLAVTLSLSFVAKKGTMKSVDYSTIFSKEAYSKISDKKVLVLAQDDGIYLKNKLGSYFLNWQLSKSVFEESDYFQTLSLIEKSFHENAPDVIIDPSDLMIPIFEKLPKWKPLYRKEGTTYTKISN